MFEFSTGRVRKAVGMVAAALIIPALGISAAWAKCAGTDILPVLGKAHPDIISKVRAAAARMSNTEAILWRVEKPGLTASHLFGTMHVSDKRITTMPPAADKALAAAKLVALEIADMSAEATMEAISQMPELMVYADGTSLSQKLNKQDFQKVETLLSASGMPKEMAVALRPWMVSILMAVPQCEQQRTESGKKSLDSRIEETATANKVPVVGLETIGSQLKSLATVPDTDQLAMLRVSLAFLKNRENLFETLIQSYLKRDIGIALALTDGMAKIAGLKDSGFASFNRELIIKRNHKMFDASLPLVDQGGAFVAVGAAHLIGDTGLVALYRKAGFSVTPIN